MLNGLTHYFNLITSQINNQAGVDITYVYPPSKSAAMGEGVYETKSGVNFRLVELEEKMNEGIGSLYYDGLDILIKDLKPDIIMLAETHIKSLMLDSKMRALIEEFNISIVLKSIPFALKKYNEEIDVAKARLKNLPEPPLNSIPAFIKPVFKLLKLNLLYKQYIYRKSFRQFMKELDLRKAIYNFADAHVNYIEEAYQIYGSYAVPKEKIFITYNSPDTDYYFKIKEKIKNEPLLLAPNQYRIIHLSRLIKWKRVDMLIDAVAQLKTDFPEIELLIIGEGPEKENLEKQATALMVTGSVKFLGGIYDAALFGKYIMSSSIYVLAGMGGLSINDAMIFGLPVICSECDGTEKYLVREGFNGLYFEKADQQSLNSKIKYFFENPVLREQMGKNSEKIIKEEINIHKVVEGYMKAFNYVIKSAALKQMTIGK
jgi:glycosyltransferase involved in cell wall biosynthesis